MKPHFTEKGVVQIFPQENGWHYVQLPPKYTEITKDFADRGLVPVTIKLGDTSWDASLLPKGDGTLFIPLNAKVRKKENVSIGDRIKIDFQVRKR